MHGGTNATAEAAATTVAVTFILLLVLGILVLSSECRCVVFFASRILLWFARELSSDFGLDFPPDEGWMHVTAKY